MRPEINKCSDERMHYCPLMTLMCGLVALGLAGCGSQEQQENVGGVAVVDLVEVVKRLDQDVNLNKSLRQERESLDRTSQVLQEQLNKKYDEKRQEFGEEPTDEQKTELTQLRNQHAVLLNRERVQVQNQLYVFQQRLVNRFREQTKPAAREVAAELGLTVVITKHEGVLTVDPNVDITDQVIAKMLENSTAPNESSDE